VPENIPHMKIVLVLALSDAKMVHARSGVGKVDVIDGRARRDGGEERRGEESGKRGMEKGRNYDVMPCGTLELLGLQFDEMS